MPFNWTININRSQPLPAPAKFDPNPLTQVAPGDQIFWANNDHCAHWPGLLNPNGTIDETFFFDNQIAPNSTSNGFALSESGTLTYACSIHPGEEGTIVVQG